MRFSFIFIFCCLLTQCYGQAKKIKSPKIATDATIKGSNAIIEASSKAELNGTTTKVTGSGMAEVSGGVVKVN